MEHLDIGLGPEFWAAISGAIVGAVIAGVIGIAGQLLAFRHARRMRQEERREIETATARITIVKTGTILSNLYRLHLHMEQSYRQAKKQDGDEPWEFVMPLASVDDPVRFTSEELTTIFSLKDSVLTNTLLTLERQHNSLVSVFSLYRTKRTELMAALSPSESKGTVVHGEFSDEEFNRHRFKMIELNSLMDQARDLAKDYYQSADAAFDLLVAQVNKNFALGITATPKGNLDQELREVMSDSHGADPT